MSEDLIYSDTTRNGERLTWKQVAEVREAEIRRLSVFATMVADLDRNANGRHEGDYDSGDPTGISQGNPHIREGQTIGYSLHRTYAYVMPPRFQRNDPEAWLQREAS